MTEKVQLSTRTFAVLDTETTPDVDGSHRVVSLAVRRVVDGEPAEASTWLVNPQTPITTAWLHGITDDMVADAPTFQHVAPQLIEFLDGDTVLVGHNVGFDLAVLRGEFRRYSLDSFPSLPYVDTMSVSYTLGVSNRTTIRLQALADSLHVAGSERSHNALADVDATIRVFLALVEKAQNDGETNINSWIVGGTPNPSPQDTTVRVLTGKHLALHQRPADDKRLSVDDVLLCVRERCGLAADKAEAVATRHTTLRLLKAFANKPPKLRNAGEAGTFAGVLQRLVPVAYTTGLDAERWYAALAPTLHSYPRCGATVETQCPACRNGDSCPLDMLHQSVAHTVLGIAPSFGTLSKDVAKQWSNRLRFKDRFDGHITPDTAPFYAYAVWLVANALNRQNHVTQAGNLVGKSVSYGLHVVEPRLALAHLPLLEQVGDLADVDAIADTYRRRTVPSTDPAFAELELWLLLFEGRNRPQAHPTTSASEAEKFGKSPRFVRPMNRVRSNKFKV